MRLFQVIVLSLLAVPATVLACEGECIVGITDAFLSNYTNPIRSLMENVAQQVSAIIPSHPDSSTTLHYFQPILDAYKQNAYSGMETAIFPRYFHGKCERDGVTPPGCPNPDCPVVCGTPGSLVHFYPKLRYIAFNQTRHILKTYTTPGTAAYDQVEQTIVDAADAGTRSRRMLHGYSPRSDLTGTTAPHFFARRLDEVKAQFKSIVDQIPSLLEQKCGGSGDGETNGLPDCSWTDTMKEYILTFP